MVKKLIVGALLLSSTAFGLPVSAASLNQPVDDLGIVSLTTPVSEDAKSAENPPTDTDSLNLKYLKGYLVDTGKIAAMPVHWESKDWLKVGLVLGAMSGLFLLDQKVKDFAQSHQSPVASKFASVGNALGNGAYTVPAVGAFYLYGQLADDHKARRVSLLALESFALSGIVTSGLKVLAERHRPNSRQSSTSWDGPHLSLKNLSFCSGHTASSFSIATIFAEEYKDHPYIPPLAYGLATLTGLSRIYGNAHWSSDVFFGGVLGYFMSKAILKLHPDDSAKTVRHLTVLPAVSREMTGLTVKYDF